MENELNNHDDMKNGDFCENQPPVQDINEEETGVADDFPESEENFQEDIKPEQENIPETENQEVKNNQETGDKIISGGEIIGVIAAMGFLALFMSPLISMSMNKPDYKKYEPPVVAQVTTEKTTEATTTDIDYNYWREVPTETADGFYSEGSYNIGNDIPYGYYMLVYNGFKNYGDAGFDIKYTPDDSDYSAWFQFSTIINLDSHGYLELNDCDAYALETFEGENNPFEHSGMFRVGVDVEPGTYKIVPTTEHYYEMWAVHENIESIDYEKIWDCEEVEYTEVTLHDGEILEMRFGRLEKIS